MNIQWYPGHMAKSKRLMADSLKHVDAVCEIVDARIPMASRNPDLNVLAKDKKRMIILNRVDQANPETTKQWSDYFEKKGYAVVQTDCKSGTGMQEFNAVLRKLLAEKLARLEAKGMGGRAIKVMIAGIPNVGKSSFINKVLGRKSAKAEDRPGVTRTNKWFAVENGIEMLDTPGILPPKIESKRNGLMLAFTGAIKDEILDIETLACIFMYELSQHSRQALEQRYNIEVKPFDPKNYDEMSLVEPNISYGYELLADMAKKRGFIVSGADIDAERTARTLFDEFRSGKLGRISLEKPKQAGGNEQNV